MALALKTAEILLLFGALGLPVNLLLLAQLDRSHLHRVLSGRLLLAPATGLAFFAVYTVFFFALGWPVAEAVVFFPLLLVLVWAAVYFLRPARPLPRRRSRPWAWLLAGAGLLVTLVFYWWPFLQNPALVLWHHTGTDGYMYIRAAEHAYSPGTGVIPFAGPYGAASGFIHETLTSFQLGIFADKPGAMSTLAGVAGLLAVTTQEAYSPLVCAVSGILFAALLALAHLRLRMPAWWAVLFALLGTISPTVWMLSTHTFFGNVLSLPLFVALLLLPRAFPSWGSATIFGLYLTAQFVVFPDGTPAIAGMFIIVAPYLLWTAWRRRRLRRLLLATALALAVAGTLGLPVVSKLFGTAKERLQGVTAGLTGPAPAAATAVPPKPRFTRLEQVEWIWGAFNVNTIPPQPLKPDERRYLVYFGALLLAFLLVAGWRRQVRELAWYVGGFLLILLLGLAGFFRGGYELFRGLAVFAYLPLAAVCLLPWLLVPRTGTPVRRLARAAVFAALVPLLWHFFQVDWRHFAYAYRAPSSEACYTTGDLRDRATLERIAGNIPLVLGTEVPSHFGVINSVMLFSNLRLGIPTAFHKFVFFSAPQPGEAAYRAPVVLRNLRYADITEAPPHETTLYRGENFELVPNDLVPFFDQDTLPAVSAYPADFIRQHALPVARAFSTRTRITFNSLRPRAVVMALQFQGAAPASLAYAFDEGPVQTAPVNPANNAALLLSPSLPSGLHHLTLEGPAQPLQLSAVWLREAEPGQPVRFDGAHRPRPAELAAFQFMSPRPARFFSQYGPNLADRFYSAHPATRLYFQVPPGEHRLQTSLLLNPGAYENLPATEASDGIQFEIALVDAGGRRTVVHSRLVNPARIAADRGVLPVDVRLVVPPQAEIEVSTGPGPQGNGARDWISLGPLTID